MITEGKYTTSQLVRDANAQAAKILDTHSAALNRPFASDEGQVATPRELLLREAESIVVGSRNTAYGNPEDNFRNIASLWNAYLVAQTPGIASDLTPQDVAHMMILMKMARLATNPAHRDSLVDIAGYAACAADCQAARS